VFKDTALGKFKDMALRVFKEMALGCSRTQR
jgi:hypothetical protein